MNKKGFTLLEIIIATGILTISVFWIYKLIWENNKIIDNSNKYLTTTLLFPVVENCLENIWINNNWFINLWNDLKYCIYSNNQVVNTIDWIDYILEFILENENDNEKRWSIEIYSDFSWKIKSEYIQKK